MSPLIDQQSKNPPSQFTLITPSGGGTHFAGQPTVDCFCRIDDSKDEASSAQSIANLGLIGVLP
jgi:hypothetical protein